MNLLSDKPRKAAIYLRISLDLEMDGLAIDRQREQCEMIAKLRQWDIVETYVDQSKSATDRTKVRPAYDQMVADYKAGAFDAIICYDLDRLTRQPRQLEDWIDASEYRGLALVTANGDADLSTDGGRMYARIKAAVARAEMERKGARQSAAQLQRAKQGRAPKGMRPLGYATNGDIIPDEAEVVRAIYSLFTRANRPESLRSLARGLSGTEHSHVVSAERAERRIAEGKKPRPVVPDGEWSPSTILGILRNPRYAQMATYTPKTAQPDGGRRRSWRAQILRDDAGEPIRGQWEAIIDDETWWRAQNILDDNERATNTSGSTKRTHLGSGLYRCGICGAKVTGAPRGYRCSKHIQRDEQGNVITTSLMRSGADVDAFVLKAIAKRLEKPDAVRTEAASVSTSTAGINAAISEQRARILRAQHDYDEEIIEGRDLKRIRDAAEARIAQLESERLMQGQAAALAPVLGSESPSQAFLDASLEIQRQVIDALATVTLLPHPRGKKTFNPDTVIIEWR